MDHTGANVVFFATVAVGAAVRSAWSTYWLFARSSMCTFILLLKGGTGHSDYVGLIDCLEFACPQLRLWQPIGLRGLTGKTIAARCFGHVWPIVWVRAPLAAG